MLKYIILGIIQGITEFLPVSSSGHLVIMQHLLGFRGEEVAISVFLHLGTALALVVFFFKDLLSLFRNFRLLMLLFTVTVITAVIGVSGKDFFERLFADNLAVAAALMVTGITLIITRKFMAGTRKEMNFKDALILGLTQAIAIIPGISRSGITVSTLLFRGIDRENSFRFAFLAAIPVILGAMLLEAKDIGNVLKAEPVNLFFGFAASFLTGILSLGVLRLVLKKSRLYYFGYYCIIIGITVILFIR